MSYVKHFLLQDDDEDFPTDDDYDYEMSGPRTDRPEELPGSEASHSAEYLAWRTKIRQADTSENPW